MHLQCHSTANKTTQKIFMNLQTNLQAFKTNSRHFIDESYYWLLHKLSKNIHSSRLATKQCQCHKAIPFAHLYRYPHIQVVILCILGIINNLVIPVTFGISVHLLEFSITFSGFFLLDKFDFKKLSLNSRDLHKNHIFIHYVEV